MKAWYHYSLFRTGFNSEICSSEHIRNIYKGCILCLMCRDIFIQVRTVYHFAYKYFFLIRSNSLTVHKLYIYFIKLMRITLSCLKPFYRYIIYNFSTLRIVINAPVAYKLPDARSKYFNVHSGRFKMLCNLTGFHFSTAGNLFCIPRYNKSYFFHFKSPPDIKFFSCFSNISLILSYEKSSRRFL